MTTDYKYAEGTDRLLSYGNESFVYDGMGNPTTYRDMACQWDKGRQLKQISDGANTVSFTYDVFGMRTSKTVNGKTTYYVYENGKLLRQTTGSDTIDFIYGRDGVIGFTLNNDVPYLYRKNLFGDVVEIYDQSGNAVGKYSYSAFGECTIELDTDGIATINPIRYRSYYYDEELNLYYLKSRYYDPAVGRFMTIDDLSYLDPENINGLNLYAYCGNNPIMNVDPSGRFLLSLFLILGGIALGTVIGGVAGGLSEIAAGGNFMDGFWGGLLNGFISTIGLAIGGAIGGPLGLVVAGLFGIGASFTGSIITNGITTDWNRDKGFLNNDFWKSATVAATINGLTNMLSFGLGNIMGASGKATSFMGRFAEWLKIGGFAFSAAAMISSPMSAIGLIFSALLGSKKEMSRCAA